MVHPVRAPGLNESFSDGGIVDGSISGGTYKYRGPLDIIPFSALWPSLRSRITVPLELLMRGPWRRIEVRCWRCKEGSEGGINPRA